MRSIRSKLTWSLMPTLVLLMLAGGGVAYYAARSFLLAQFDSSLRTMAWSLAALVEFENGRFEMEFTDEVMRRFEPGPNSDRLMVWSGEGDVLLRSRSLEGHDLPRHHAARAAGEPFDVTHLDGQSQRAVSLVFPPRGNEEVFDLASDDGESERAMHIVFPPRVGEDQPDRSARLEVWDGLLVELVLARNRDALDAALGSFARGIALMEAVLLLAVLVVVHAGVRRGLVPLDELAIEVAAVDESSLGRRVSTDRQPQELRSVGAKLNELLDRLQSAFDRERRFSSAAAHELRTPIAELRALTESALLWPEGRTEDERRGELTQAHDIACQMDRLVQALLAIARDGKAANGHVRESVPLAAVVESARQRIADVAACRRIALAVRCADDVRVRTSRVALEILLGNLLENAVEYAPEGTLVELLCGPDGDASDGGSGDVVVRVVNEAGALDHGDLPHLFEPFWRKDESRTDPRHSGLGLTVSETLARALEIPLSARLEPTGHVTFALRLEPVRVSATTAAAAPR